MRRHHIISKGHFQLLSFIIMIVLLASILSCATKTRMTGANNQSLPLADQKAIYDLLVKTALDKMRDNFNWYDLDCYVEFPDDVPFGMEIISSYDFPVPFRPASECKLKGRGAFAHIYGKKTHRDGILLTFDEIDNIEGNSVRCGFGWYHASLSSHSWSYKLEKTDGKWAIKETLLEIIS